MPEKDIEARLQRLEEAVILIHQALVRLVENDEVLRALITDDKE